MHTLCLRTNRGAARHWVIGCLIVIVVIVGILAAGGYYISKKLGIGVMDVAAKNDPAPDASADVLLPTMVGSFTRTAVTSNTAEMAELMSKVPGDHKVGATSGTIAALYTDATNKSALVLALDTEEAQKTGDKQSPVAQAANSEDSSKGFHMQINIKAVQLGMAAWSKPNWTYAVLTTDTQALEFANQFEPGK